jgi:nucleotide-binding universal stress UspA family protein
MKLLVATDGSENALRAVEYAIEMLGKMKESGSVTLISVHDDTALRHAQRFVGKEVVDDYLRELSDTDLAEARKLLEKSGIRHDNVIRTGHVASEVVKSATDGGFDMIVLGSKGRSALKDLVIGSVAKRIIEMSATPVLLVR